MISPSDIKAGAQFVVTVEADDIRRGFVVIGRGYESTHVPISTLSPLPAPSPTAAIDAEIVKAVDKWMAEYRTANVQPRHFYSLLFQSLINRRRAMLKQKDAVGELLEAVDIQPSQFFSIAELTENSQLRKYLSAVRDAAARVRKEREE